MQTQKKETGFDKLQSGTGTWSSLDIFLFANGQQYSPPRKYNLRSSELDWWDATLTYLARAQYGSKQTSIELYSIDGKKIGGPMELSNGAAYVAVEPPDSFVQSGYEKYLIKASRSWEKRQEKRTSDSALSKPDVNVANEIIKQAENNDSTNIQIIQDIRILPATTAPTAQDQTVITVKSESVTKAKTNGVANSIKQIPKKKPSATQQRPSILRKSYVNPVSPLARKGSRDSRVTKVDSTKKKIESSTKRSESRVPLKNGSLLTTQIITESKLESTSRIDNGNTVLQPTIRNEPSIATFPLPNRLENKPEQIDVQKDDLVEKDILSVSFHSEENLQSICINANNSCKGNIPISLNDTKQSVPTTPNAVSYQSTFGSNQFTLPSSIDDRVARKNYVVSDSQTAENIIISINPGDTVKLKLSIQLENSSSSVDTRRNEHHVKQPSAPIATKSDLESPGRHVLAVNTPSTRPDGEAPTVVTKSWQTTFTNENIEEEINDAQLAVCRCDCCLNSDKVLPAGATRVYVDNNNYFILLPSANNTEKIISCNCDQGNSEGDERELVLPRITNSTVESPSVKEHACISKMQSKASECQCPIFEPAVAKDQTSTFEDSQLSKFMPTKGCTCDDTYRYASDSIFRMPSTNNPTTLKDNSTQTNWNNILLEARLHKDGHYTFHMPPLDKIKFDNAL